MGESAADRFKRNYFEWAQSQWAAEISRDFPRLGTIPSQNTHSAVSILRTFLPDQQAVLVRAMTKRFHPDAAAALQQDLSQDERALLAKFDLARTALDSPPLVMGSHMVRKRMGTLLKARLAFLGPIAPLAGAGSWVHSLIVGSWTIETRVEALGRFSEASICHRLSQRTDGELVDFVSYSAALGVSSLTNWSIGDSSDGEAAADGIASLSEWFLSELFLLLGTAPH